MGPKNRTSKKSEKQIKQEILEDWASVRQWIDELQHEWTERHKTTRAEDTKQQTSSEK